MALLKTTVVGDTGLRLLEDHQHLPFFVHFAEVDANGDLLLTVPSIVSTLLFNRESTSES